MNNMNPVNLAIAIAMGIVGLALGFFFGLMPMRTYKMTDKQNRLQQWLAIAFILVIILLMYFKQDAASWAIILAAIVGMAIAKIPAINRRLLAKFKIFKPRKARNNNQASPANHPKSKKNNRKKHRHVH
ncbi:hypothetical protein [Bifidobacterium sp. ESL0764]|uniref:hypothetical protein n=1 Tax=Bifidobacterium sp. ESL0764 TaxID=2983228 RepID=UPI0023F9FBF0|nr:hypothetical protein [Bifidobacterium sp. ESL0764]WEV65092.1 hypothetical protein OZX71_04735 [Bifidobacterium sp. ESL0764]